MHDYYHTLRSHGLTALQAFGGLQFALAYERYNGVPAPDHYLRDVTYVVRRASVAGLRDLIRIAKKASA